MRWGSSVSLPRTEQEGGAVRQSAGSQGADGEPGRSLQELQKRGKAPVPAGRRPWSLSSLQIHEPRIANGSKNTNAKSQQTESLQKGVQRPTMAPTTKKKVLKKNRDSKA